MLVVGEGEKPSEHAREPTTNSKLNTGHIGGKIALSLLDFSSTEKIFLTVYSDDLDHRNKDNKVLFSPLFTGNLVQKPLYAEIDKHHYY